MLMPCAIKWDPLNDYTEAHISIGFISIYVIPKSLKKSPTGGVDKADIMLD